VAPVDRSMQEYYAARAPYYDAVYEKPERASDLAFLKHFLPQKFAGLALLEIACGTGYWSQYLAVTARRMCAIDATIEPLEFAKVRPNCDEVNFQLASAYDLPETLGKFSGAFAGLWLSHVPVERRPEFLESLHARLEPGSLVVLLDNSKVQCIEYPIVETDSLGNTYQSRKLRDGSQHRVLKNFPSKNELQAMIERVGKGSFYEELENFWLFGYELRSAP
jgi:SAM-dependent methyltransferase